MKIVLRVEEYQHQSLLLLLDEENTCFAGSNSHQRMEFTAASVTGSRS